MSSGFPAFFAAIFTRGCLQTAYFAPVRFPLPVKRPLRFRPREKRAHPEDTLFFYAVFRYLFIWITVSSMVSTVVMFLELAWNPRCVAIMFTNSRARSTLLCSRA